MSASNDDFLGRRNALGAVGAGLAAMAVSTNANAQGAPGVAPDGPAAAPKDPRSAYPRPPFAKQQQPLTGLASLGGLDILVNNAGYQQSHASIADISTESFDATFKTNVYALFWITKEALPHLKPGSTIVNTASINAYDPSEDLFDYAATKAAIGSFTKSLAKQLADKGIRVNAVAPGPYWTPLQPSGGQDPEKLPKFGADTPMRRPGQPAEIAPLYVLLASERRELHQRRRLREHGRQTRQLKRRTEAKERGAKRPVPGTRLAGKLASGRLDRLDPWLRGHERKDHGQVR